MDLLDTIQLTVAVWGAGLATYLGVRELRKEGRTLRVYLDHVWWVERHQLIVVNVGHRPVTVTEVAVRLIPKPGGPSDVEYSRPLWPVAGLDDRPAPKLPVTLTDGQSMTFLMDERVGEFLGTGDFDFRAYARDAEGKEYATSTLRKYDAKYGYYVG